MTRTLTGEGVITQPALLWSKRLGGTQPTTLVQDVDGDGLDEVLQLVGGRLVSMDPMTGATKWATRSLALGRFLLDGDGRARDMDGDGVVDILVNKAHLGDTRVYAIDGVSGAIHWTFGQGLGPSSGRAGGNRHFLGDVDGDGHPEFVLYITLTTPPYTVYCFDFMGGYEGDVLQWTTTEFDFGSTHYVPMFDVTGDGLPELLLSSLNTMRIFDGATGTLLGETPFWLDGITASTVLLAHGTQVDSDPAREIASFHRGIGGWAGIYDVNASTGAVEKRWRVDFTAATITIRPLDFDGDGRQEYVLSTYDTEASTWTMSILDGGTGEERAAVSGVALVRVGADLDGDGAYDLVGMLTDSNPMPAYGELQAFSWDGGESLVPRWGEPLEAVQVRDVLDLDEDGTEELLVYRDTDGDSTADRIALIDEVGGAAVITHEMSFPKDLVRAYQGSATSLGAPKAPGILVFAGDGFLDLVDANFEPIGTRLPTGGYSPTILAAATSPDGTLRAWVTESSGRLLAVDTGSGAPEAPPETDVVVDLPTRGEVLALVDVDGDDEREVFIMMVDGDVVSYELRGADGSARWTFAHPGASTKLATGVGAGADLDGDTVLDFYLQTRVDGLLVGLPLSGADGQPLSWSWVPYQPNASTGLTLSPPVLDDLDGDGLADVFVLHGGDDVLGDAGGEPFTGGAIHALGGLEGQTLATSNVVTVPTRMVSADVDADPATRDVVMSWWGGRAAVSVTPAAEIVSLWQTTGPPAAPGQPILVDTDGDGISELLDYDTLGGLIHLTRTADGTPMWPGDGVAHDGVRRISGGAIYRELLEGGFEPVGGGEVVSELPWTQLRTDAIAVTNLTGLGHPSLVIGSFEGVLYCIDLTDGSLDWAYDLGTEIGPIVAADTTGDGLVELLLTAGDGYLYALGQLIDLGTVDTVVDGSFQDLDLVPPGTEGFGTHMFTASWTAPSGGATEVEGYLIRLITDTGAVIADWEDVGDVLTVTHSMPVPMVAGQVYQTVVLPYGQGGSGQEALSDGFWLDAEWFAAEVADDAPDAVDDEAPAVGSVPVDDAIDEGVAASPSGCGDCAGGGPSPGDVAWWGLCLVWLIGRRRGASPTA